MKRDCKKLKDYTPVELAFLADLKAFLERWSCDISVTDEWQGWSECGQDLHINFEFIDKTGESGSFDVSYMTYL